QYAFVIRCPPETGISWPSFSAVKLPIPCLSCVLPVAMEVQSTGDLVGTKLFKGPEEPPWINFWMFGSFPSLNGFCIRFQLAPSIPIKYTFCFAGAASVVLLIFFGR